MSYIEHSLGQSESLLYRAHFPWFYGGSGWALLIVSAILAAVAEWSGYGLLAIAFLLVGVVLLLLVMVPIWTTEIGVTDQRFIFKRGLLWRATQELQLRAIEEVNLEQGLLGRMFDFAAWNCAGPAWTTSVCRRSPNRWSCARRCRMGWPRRPSPASLPSLSRLNPTT